MNKKSGPSKAAADKLVKNICRKTRKHYSAGARRKDDRRVISGVIHVLKSGRRWQGCPRGLWQKIFEEPVGQADTPQDLSIDSTAVRAHRSMHGAKGGRRFTASDARVAAPLLPGR